MHTNKCPDIYLYGKLYFYLNTFEYSNSFDFARLSNEYPNVFTQTKLTRLNLNIDVKIIDPNKCTNNRLWQIFLNIFVTLFSCLYGDSSNSGKFGDFGDYDKTGDSGESDDSGDSDDSDDSVESSD